MVGAIVSISAPANQSHPPTWSGCLGEGDDSQWSTADLVEARLDACASKCVPVLIMTSPSDEVTR
jgi:hypothetical protein